MQPLMNTDSERLMEEGIRTGQQAFERFLENLRWERGDIDATFCHQVGGTHRRMMLQSLSLPAENDYFTFPWLGNTGTAALPITAAIGLGSGRVAAGSRLAMLGIGSGINCMMLGVDWQKTAVRGGVFGDQLENFSWSQLAELEPSAPSAGAAEFTVKR